MWAIRRCLEISREHGNELVMLKIDLSAAFGRLLHSAVIRSLGHKHAPTVLLGLTAKLLSGLQCTLKLGNSVSDMVAQQCGVPQGAPEAPSMFPHALDFIVGELVIKWWGKGYMWSANREMLHASTREHVEVSHVLFADDIMLLCRSVESAQTILVELEEAWEIAGLTIHVGKMDDKSPAV